MTIKEIVTKLEEIEGSLDDAFYSLPEYNANTDSRDYIDSARTELDYLKYVIEKEEITEMKVPRCAANSVSWDELQQEWR